MGFLQRRVEKILRNALHNIIEDFDISSMRLSLSQSHIHLKDIYLRPDFLSNILHLPIVECKVGSFSFTLAFKNESLISPSTIEINHVNLHVKSLSFDISSETKVKAEEQNTEFTTESETDSDGNDGSLNVSFKDVLFQSSSLLIRNLQVIVDDFVNLSIGQLSYQPAFTSPVSFFSGLSPLLLMSHVTLSLNAFNIEGIVENLCIDAVISRQTAEVVVDNCSLSFNQLKAIVDGYKRPEPVVEVQTEEDTLSTVSSEDDAESELSERKRQRQIRRMEKKRLKQQKKRAKEKKRAKKRSIFSSIMQSFALDHTVELDEPFRLPTSLTVVCPMIVLELDACVLCFSSVSYDGRGVKVGGVKLTESNETENEAYSFLNVEECELILDSIKTVSVSLVCIPNIGFLAQVVQLQQSFLTDMLDGFLDLFISPLIAQSVTQQEKKPKEFDVGLILSVKELKSDIVSVHDLVLDFNCPITNEWHALSFGDTYSLDFSEISICVGRTKYCGKWITNVLHVSSSEYTPASLDAPAVIARMGASESKPSSVINDLIGRDQSWFLQHISLAKMVWNGLKIEFSVASAQCNIEFNLQDGSLSIAGPNFGYSGKKLEVEKGSFNFLLCWKNDIIKFTVHVHNTVLLDATVSFQLRANVLHLEATVDMRDQVSMIRHRVLSCGVRASVKPSISVVLDKVVVNVPSIYYRPVFLINRTETDLSVMSDEGIAPCLPGHRVRLMSVDDVSVFSSDDRVLFNVPMKALLSGDEINPDTHLVELFSQSVGVFRLNRRFTETLLVLSSRYGIVNGMPMGVYVRIGTKESYLKHGETMWLSASFDSFQEYYFQFDGTNPIIFEEAPRRVNVYPYFCIRDVPLSDIVLISPAVEICNNTSFPFTFYGCDVPPLSNMFVFVTGTEGNTVALRNEHEEALFEFFIPREYTGKIEALTWSGITVWTDGSTPQVRVIVEYDLVVRNETDLVVFVDNKAFQHVGCGVETVVSDQEFNGCADNGAVQAGKMSIVLCTVPQEYVENTSRKFIQSTSSIFEEFSVDRDVGSYIETRKLVVNDQVVLMRILFTIERREFGWLLIASATFQIANSIDVSMKVDVGALSHDVLSQRFISTCFCPPALLVSFNGKVHSVDLSAFEDGVGGHIAFGDIDVEKSCNDSITRWTVIAATQESKPLPFVGVDIPNIDIRIHFLRVIFGHAVNIFVERCNVLVGFDEDMTLCGLRLDVSIPFVVGSNVLLISPSSLDSLFSIKAEFNSCLSSFVSVVNPADVRVVPNLFVLRSIASRISQILADIFAETKGKQVDKEEPVVNISRSCDFFLQLDPLTLSMIGGLSKRASISSFNIDIDYIVVQDHFSSLYRGIEFFFAKVRGVIPVLVAKTIGNMNILGNVAGIFGVIDNSVVLSPMDAIRTISKLGGSVLSSVGGVVDSILGSADVCSLDGGWNEFLRYFLDREQKKSFSVLKIGKLLKGGGRMFGFKGSEQEKHPILEEPAEVLERLRWFFSAKTLIFSSEADD
ncbi:hypothetical protein PCE1_004426 [Barthelona sp. PCE]